MMSNKNKEKEIVSSVVLIVLNLLDIHQPDSFQIDVINSLVRGDVAMHHQKQKNSGLFL